MAPLPWWRRVLSRRDREVRAPGSGRRPPAGVVVGNRPLAGARWRDRRSAPQRGFVRESVRNVWPAGCWGSSPGRLYLFSPLPAPLPWSVSFPRRFREARWDRRPRAGVLLCRPARRRAAAPGTAPQGPDGPKRFNRHHHIDGRCHPGSVQDARYPGPGRPSTWRAPARRSSLGTDRRWSPSDAAQGPGVEPDATGGGHQVPPRRSAPAATGSAFTLVERPAQLLAAPRPSGPVSGTEPGHGPGRSTVVVPEPARGRTALPDRRPWRRSGDSRRESVRTWRRWRCVGLLPPGCLSLFSAARLPLPWFVRIPRRFREARQTGGHGRYRCRRAGRQRLQTTSLPHRRQWVVIRKVHRYAVAVVLLRRRRASPSPQLDRTGSPERPEIDRLLNDYRPLSVEDILRFDVHWYRGGPRGSIRPGRATWNRCSGRTACESGPFGGSCTGWERGIAKPETDPVVWQHVDRPGHGSSTTWTTRTESGTGRATSAISPGNRTRSASAARA